jgi:hypothetical protein
MFMAKSFFTDLTIVKVLADTTFVSDTSDWADATTITFNFSMSDYLTCVNLFLVG